MSVAVQGRRPSTLVLALAAALVAALGVIVWLAVDDGGSGTDEDRARELSSREQAGEAALAEAKKILVDVTTYSHQDGQHEFAWLEKIASAELKEKLAPNVPALQKAIVDGQVSATGQVIDAAARVVDTGQVEVVAFVDQALSDEANKDVKIEEQRVSMTMRLRDGDWLVERLELLSGATADTGAGDSQSGD